MSMPLAPVRPASAVATHDYVKRSIDILVAIAALLVLAPLMIVIALSIKLSSPGPMLFRQVRVGKDRRSFVMLKFRTMTHDNDDSAHREYVSRLLTEEAPPDGGSPGLYKLANDPRVTTVGRWLRKTSLDELPQLVNVLRGDMSLVGPRPCIPYEVEHFAPHHLERFAVPAGLTGLWQVTARAHSTFREALDMDVAYARAACVSLDLRLLFRTPLQMVRQRQTT